MTQTMKQLKNGIIDQNPALVLTLGMCPALAATSALTDAAGMGLATAAVLIFANLTVSALRRLIPEKIRIAAFTVIIAGFVSVLDYMMQAFLPSQSESLGIFIPLIVVNCVIFARAEVFAYRNGVVRSVIDGLAMGAGFLTALMAVAAVRELLSAGTLFDFRVLPESFPGISVMAKPPGGFLALGLAMAVMQAARRKGRTPL